MRTSRTQRIRHTSRWALAVATIKDIKDIDEIKEMTRTFKSVRLFLVVIKVTIARVKGTWIRSSAQRHVCVEHEQVRYPHNSAGNGPLCGHLLEKVPEECSAVPSCVIAEPSLCPISAHVELVQSRAWLDSSHLCSQAQRSMAVV